MSTMVKHQRYTAIVNYNNSLLVHQWDDERSFDWYQKACSWVPKWHQFAVSDLNFYCCDYTLCLYLESGLSLKTGNLSRIAPVSMCLTERMNAGFVSSGYQQDFLSTVWTLKMIGMFLCLQTLILKRINQTFMQIAIRVWKCCVNEKWIMAWDGSSHTAFQKVIYDLQNPFYFCKILCQMHGNTYDLACIFCSFWKAL